MSARDEILARIRAAVTDVPSGSGPDETDVPRDYLTRREVDDVAALFAERVADYQATVVRVAPNEVAGAVEVALALSSATRVLVPAGLPTDWLPEDAGLEILGDDPPLAVEVLDGVAAVVTGASVGVATTGTIVLDHSEGQGRRALTLVPDVHVCVVTESQVVADVPEAVGQLQSAVDAGRALTWISGPSATSDIELDRVEGVHGPRTLYVVLVAGEG